MTNSPQTEERTLPKLSSTTVEHLERLRGSNPAKFHALVASLRTRKWPLRAIADELGVSRSIVAVWEKKGREAPDPKVEVLAEDMPENLPKMVRPVYSTYTLSDEQKKELFDLAREASTVRRFTDRNAPSRKAAETLENKLHAHRESGASLADLARACGVSRRAIAQRLEKRTWAA